MQHPRGSRWDYNATCKTFQKHKYLDLQFKMKHQNSIIVHEAISNQVETMHAGNYKIQCWSLQLHLELFVAASNGGPSLVVASTQMLMMCFSPLILASCPAQKHECYLLKQSQLLFFPFRKLKSRQPTSFNGETFLYVLKRKYKLGTIFQLQFVL